MSVTKNDLLTFINKYKSEKGKPFTNTSIGYPRIAINIPTDNYDNFLNLYALAITSGLSLHLTEKQLEPSPLRIDLDFRFSQEILSDDSGIKLVRKYNDNHIYKIIDSYFNLINTFLNICNEANIAYIMEKPNPSLFRNKIKMEYISFFHIL